ncbi:MAG: hypothetical protein AAGC85_20565 [Bacteroidota bacterium]
MLSFAMVSINLLILLGGFTCLLIFLLKKPFTSIGKDDNNSGNDGGIPEVDWDRPLDLPPGVYASSDIQDPVSV